MVFDAFCVQALNMAEHIDFIQCSGVHVHILNTWPVSPCFCFVFKCSQCSPLKGAAQVEHAAPIRGHGVRV